MRLKHKQLYRSLLLIEVLLTLLSSLSCKKAKVDNPTDEKKITYGSVSDIEGNTYKTVTIGTQTWMAENLKAEYYRNGDHIGTTIPCNKEIWGETNPKYQWSYADVYGNLAMYGRLYTWYAITDSRNICPVGWHIATDAEWTTLTDYLGGDSAAANKLMEAGSLHWAIENRSADINETGFTALPGGYRDNGLFSSITTSGYWWTASELNSIDAWCRYMIRNDSHVYRKTDYKKMGFSVRCVKD